MMPAVDGERRLRHPAESPEARQERGPRDVFRLAQSLEHGPLPGVGHRVDGSLKAAADSQMSGVSTGPGRPGWTTRTFGP